MKASLRSLLFDGIVALALLTACARPAAAPPSPAAPTAEAPTAAATAAATTAPSPSPYSSAIIEKYRAAIPQMMAAQGLPGLALAVVDENGVVWAEGLGYTDTDHRTAVTPDTPFSLQSASKMVTADTVMLAVQDGLVDLDTPITSYLPDFTVNSIFEEHPERKITLRMLLSHRAGFPHDSAVGNNNDLGQWQFEPHIKSIGDTWLRFPVDSAYAYSNLGLDLAAYIVQIKAGKAFPQYAQERLFEPLGMKSTTYDQARIRQTAGRAIGHMKGVSDLPVEVGIQGSGGLYSTASDMARFVQWHLRHGLADGKPVLSAALLDETYKPRNPVGAVTGYGLGTANFQADGLKTLGHSGGGFGFLSDVYWFPDLGLGGVVLTNSVDHDLQQKLVFQMLYDIAHDPAGRYAARLAAVPASPEGQHGCPTNNCLPADLADRIARLRMTVTAADEARWQGYAGDYTGQFWQLEVPAYVKEQDGRLIIGSPGLLPDTPLTEVQPGLFFTPDGEVLDLRGPVPTFSGIRLTKVSKATE
jgi:CubicO group peptidase (beta-lactamase class C family)